MIDIHSHYIPNVDDGFDKLENSLDMLKKASELGITDVICTPHYREPFLSSYENVRKAFEDYKDKVRENNIPVNLYLGREFFCGRDILKNLEMDNYFMPNGKYVLLEFSSFNTNDICEIVYEIALKGYIPVVAHIERYSKVTFDDAMDVKASGGLIQVNADSIVRVNKKYYRRRIKALLKRGAVDFVASDMHAERENEMARAYSYVERKFGKEYADKIFIENAREIIKS